MMRNSIATYKESLSRITSDVRSADNGLENSTARGGEDAWIADRRVSHRFAQSTSPRRFPSVDNGVGSASAAEIELHKAEIQRLKTSEAEIKALAVNYAAILKEKEEELSRIHEENSKLKKIVDAKDAFTQVSKAENFEVSAEQSPKRQYSHASQGSPRSTLNNEQRAISKQQLSMNGSIQAGQFEGVNQKMYTNLQGSEKEPEYPFNGNGRTMSQKQMKHASEVRELRVQLDVERENLASVTRNFQEQHKKNETLQKVLHDLEMEKDRMSLRIKEMQNDVEVKVSEIKQLQLELDRKNLDEESNGSLAKFQDAVLALQNENAKLKMEKVELESKLKYKMDHEQEKFETQSSELANKYSSLNEANEELTKKVQQLESTLALICKERDKARQELNRLKQHLLNKELEESDKMDEDSKIIEELQANVADLRAHILKLEKALKQENMKNGELNRAKSDELGQANETINGLKRKIANYMSILESKNIELQNLQTALGQYYAEAEAKGRLEREIVVAREESTKLSKLLKDAIEQLEKSKKEREDVFSKLGQAERMSSDGKLAVQKLQEDNSKLRRTLEQSMTRINRMSLDSDYSVDRRIVIKLLVTYFERNHSKEVLGLMVRMLGFSEEDKQRIGLAQRVASKGVVRGVLGFPGRIVGGILGGGSPEGYISEPSENLSFADLWVDFLLKETEEREKKELADASRKSTGAQEKAVAAPASAVSDRRTGIPSSSTNFATVYSYPDSISSPFLSKQVRSFEHSDSEFASVPFSSSASASANSDPFSRPTPRY